MQIDFYILNKELEGKTLEVACRLLEKAYLRKHRVFVLTEDIKTAETLDELLWTFKADSFIPHNIQGEGPNPPPPIQIGMDEPNTHVTSRDYKDILLNLTQKIPSSAQKFRRIIEIVDSNEAAKQNSRNRYRQYNIPQNTLNIHHIEKL